MYMNTNLFEIASTITVFTYPVKHVMLMVWGESMGGCCHIKYSANFKNMKIYLVSHKNYLI